MRIDQIIADKLVEENFLGNPDLDEEYKKWCDEQEKENDNT